MGKANTRCHCQRNSGSDRYSLIDADQIPILIWGSSPKSAKTYGKDGRRGPFSPRSSVKSPHFQPPPRNIAHNCGVQSAVGAMFAHEPAYFAQ